MVNGGRIGSLEVVIITTKRGHKVRLYEKELRIRGQLNVASIPPNQEEIKSLISYYKQQIKRYGVNLHLWREITIKEENPDVIVLTTGSVPKKLRVTGSKLPHIFQPINVLLGKRGQW
jgi:NADPH-dependent 2,4-dienoyl-CoA reductase/sulfur reductase-like enzyme